MGTNEERLSSVEKLNSMMSRLADSNVTIAEANALRLVILRLLDELGHATDSKTSDSCFQLRFGS